MRIPRALFFAVAVLTLLAAASSAWAVLVVDQEQLGFNNDFDATGSSYLATCQQFKPTVSQIDALELYLKGWGSGGGQSNTVYVDLYHGLSGSGSKPDIDAGILGTASRGFKEGVETLGQWYEVAFSSPITLTPGNQYCMVVWAWRSSSLSNPKFGAEYQPGGDPYPDGGYIAWLTGDTNANVTWGDDFEDGVKDMSFKTLYEDVAPPTPKNRGDVTEDLFVGADDLVRILTHWGESGAGVTWGDGDCAPYGDGITTGDQFVGADDYVEVLSMWGTSYPAEPTPTPEPATLGLLLLGGLIGIVRRK